MCRRYDPIPCATDHRRCRALVSVVCEWSSSFRLGTDSTFVLIAPSDNDSVRVTLQSSAFCVTTTDANASYTIDVIAAVSPSVSLQLVPSDTLCAGDPLTATASAINAGSGTYSWYLNGVLQGITDSIFTSSSLADGDVLVAVVQSGLSCALTPSDGDTVQFTVLPVEAPAISISPVSAGLCEGQPIQLAASYSNGGSSPSIVWDVNGVFLSTNDTITATLLNGDVVTVTLGSNSRCATSPTASATYQVVLQPVVTPPYRSHPLRAIHYVWVKVPHSTPVR